MAQVVEEKLNQLEADKRCSFNHYTKYSITHVSNSAALITWYDFGPMINSE